MVQVGADLRVDQTGFGEQVELPPAGVEVPTGSAEGCCVRILKDQGAAGASTLVNARVWSANRPNGAS